MAVDVQNITHGPAQFKVGGSEISHTQGGVTVRVSPKQRMRTVDKYGESPIDVIHQGDEVRVVAPLAEWTAAVLGAIYDPGNDATAGADPKYMGVGRTSGYIYTKSTIDVVPFLTTDATKLAHFFACSPVGQIELAHNNEDDRVFNAEFVACVDTSEEDGELIGKIYLTDALGS